MENLKDRVTIYEVAKRSGVSLATVSRVINKRGNVTQTTRDKVEKVINELGYKPSGLAQALATSRSTNIGVVIPATNYVYIANLLNGITEIIKEKGFDLTLFVTSNSQIDAMNIVERVITSHVDGAIIFDNQLEEEEIIKISSYCVPTIAINNKIYSDKVGCITFGYQSGLRNLLLKQFEDGFDKEILFLDVENGGRLLKRIKDDFIKTCNNENKDYKIITLPDSYDGIYKYFISYFKKYKNKYVIAFRDSIAAAVINAASDCGLIIPEELEVLSLIGTRYADILRPTITTMDIDMHDVGRKAVEMLLSLSNNELENKIVKIVSTYNKRSSTKK